MGCTVIYIFWWLLSAACAPCTHFFVQMLFVQHLPTIFRQLMHHLPAVYLWDALLLLQIFIANAYGDRLFALHYQQKSVGQQQMVAGTHWGVL